MKLYDFLPSGNGYKARLILAHRGLRYEHVPVDILRAETRTAEFLSRNPNGRIPVLELDDGTHLCESNAILYYLGCGQVMETHLAGQPYFVGGRFTIADI